MFSIIKNVIGKKIPYLVTPNMCHIESGSGESFVSLDFFLPLNLPCHLGLRSGHAVLG